MSLSIKDILQQKPIGTTLEVKGWVRTFRSNRFIALSDGSTIKTLQLVVDFENLEEGLLKKIATGAAIRAKGDLLSSQGKGQDVEIHVTDLEVLGESNPEEYPLQPKKHSMEFLRDIAHLRMRTNTFGAVMRIRHHLAYAVHDYFHKKQFFYLHTPIITGSDA